jgi:hypothetical protein
MSTLPRISRHFPDMGWAWPSGGLDLLIRAAAGTESETSLAAAREWLARNDIDNVRFREHRLLAAIAERFGRRLKDDPASPRLNGLQRLLWVRSQMAVREARPVLAALSAHGIPMMLLKGAARVALDPAAARSRISHDIDILVSPDRMTGAFELITGQGWEPATGASAHVLRTTLPRIRAVNFWNGDHGDIDLHRSAYHPVHADSGDDDSVWQRAIHAEFSGLPVLIPSTADRLAMGIAHGVLDAHAHSDWLIDCHEAIERADLDWPAFLDIVDRRRLAGPAAIVLTYLSHVLGSRIPAQVLNQLQRSWGALALSSRAAILLQARPRDDGGVVFDVLRGVAKQLRMREPRDNVAPSGIRFRGRRSFAAFDPKPGGVPVLAERFTAPPGSGLRFRLMIDCHVPAVRRRIEFELRGETGTPIRLSYRKWDGGTGTRRLIFSGVTDPHFGGRIMLEARPARHLRPQASADELARHGAIPFVLAGCEFLTS